MKKIPVGIAYNRMYILFLRHQLMHFRLELQVLHYLFALAEAVLYSPVVLPCDTFLNKESLAL